MSRSPSIKHFYRAVAERDSSFEGIFFVGVKTTGVFCRPGCPAKTPLLQNCEFFEDARAALHAGYRPCLRCKPMDRRREPPAVVRVLRDRVEKDPSRRITDADIAALDIDPSTARRQFLKHCGMTFHAYQRARRMGLALRTLQKGGDMTRAAEVGGYESLSGFSAAFSGIFGEPPSSGDQLRCLLADWIPTPLGPMVAIATDEALCLLEFHDRRALEREIAWLRRHFRAAIVPGKNAVLRQAARELGEYFAGERSQFNTPVLLEGSAFQTRVWRALQAIEPGKTRSYAHIAAEVGSPGGHRAVGRANGDNRIAILIPCHRVIATGGALAGYGGGIWRKRWLLDHEARMARSGSGRGAERSRLSVPLDAANPAPRGKPRLVEQLSSV